MNKDDIQFTKLWWTRCLADLEKLTKWLQKLQKTEIGGFYDYQIALSDFAPELTDRTRRIFENIGGDENKHSNILLDLFQDRKIQEGPNTEDMISTYWKQMNSSIVDLDTFCAVNYYGEGLAAFRFEIIHDISETPSDIKEFISRALPDEVFHRETLKRLAKEETLIRIAQLQQDAVARLKGSR